MRTNKQIIFFRCAIVCLVNEFAFFAYTSAWALGTKPTLTQKGFVAQMYVDDVEVEDLWLFPHKERSQFFVESASVKEALKPLLALDRYTSLDLLPSNNGAFSLAQLDAIGFKFDFDEATLNLSIHFPLEWRNRASIDLVKDEYQKGFYLGASPFFGNMRFYGSTGFEKNSQSTQNRLPTLLENNFALGTPELLLEGQVDYDESRASQYRRNDVRLVHDSKSNLTRTTVGDLEPVAVSFQSANTVGGVSYRKVFGIQPYLNIRPVSRTEVLIKRPSMLEIYINGTLYTRFRVQAGPVNLQKFPVSSGLNKVTIKTTDDLGKTESMDLNLLFDANLLAQGTQEFTFDFGYPYQEDGFQRRYDTHKPNALMYYRYGWSDQLLSGVNLQTNQLSQMAGMELLGLTSLGLVSTDIGASHFSGQSPDMAVRLKYRTLDFWGQVTGDLFKRVLPTPVVVNTSLEYRGSRFSAPTQVLSINTTAWIFDIQSVFKLPLETSLNVGANFQFNRQRDLARRSYLASVTKTFAGNISFSANANMSKTDVWDKSLLLTLSWTPDKIPIAANSFADVTNSSYTVSLDRYYNSPVTDWALGANYNQNATSQEVTVNPKYRGYRMELGETTSWQKDRASYQTTSSHRIFASSSLVFTKDAISWSRPVTDSFAIFKTSGNSGYKLLVNPTDEGALAQADRWGPAVIPELNSYYRRSFIFDVENANAGTKITPEFLELLPSYKSGVSVVVDINRFISMRSQIVDSQGRSLKLQSGRVLNSKSGAEVASFFSNREGKIFVEGLLPGSYLLEINDDHYLKAPFEVPDEIFSDDRYVHKQPIVVPFKGASL